VSKIPRVFLKIDTYKQRNEWTEYIEVPQLDVVETYFLNLFIGDLQIKTIELSV